MVKCFLYVCVLIIIPILGQFKRIYRKRIIANNTDDEDEDDDDGYDNTKDSLCLGFIRFNHMYG